MGGQKNTRIVNHEDIIDFSFGRHCRKNVPQAAAAMDLSPKWIRAFRAAAASAYMHWQGKTLGHLVRLAKLRRPQLVVCRTAWDETGQRLRTQREELSTEQQAGTWEVMVCRQRVVVVWPSGSAVQVEMTLPPCIIPSPSAPNIYAGIFHNPASKHILAAREILFGLAEKGVDISETGAATSNYRVEAHLIGRRTRGTSKGHFVCRLHQHHIIETTVVCTTDDKTLSRIYSFACLMRSSNYFMRLTWAIPSSLRDMKFVQAGGNDFVPLDMAACHDELAQYIFLHANRFRAAQDQQGIPNLGRGDGGLEVDSESDDEEVLFSMLADKREWLTINRVANLQRGGRTKRLKAELMQECANFFGMWNGPRWEASPVHYCRGCCQGPDESKKKKGQTARALLFRRRPEIPAMNKWNKLGPVLDFLLPLVLVHSLLSKCFGFIKAPAQVEAATADERGVDEALKAEMNFSKIIGLRFASCSQFFAASGTPALMLGLAIVLELLRACTAWWLRRGRASDFHTRSYLLDALFDQLSPLTFAAQYLSSLLEGASGRLVLWWRSAAASYDQFCAAVPDSVRALRRLVLVAAAGLFRRHQCTFSSLEWAIPSVCDDRVPLERKHALAERFDKTSSCCIPPGTVRDLKLGGTTGQDLLTSTTLHQLLHWRCHVICQSVVDIEWKHGQSRASLTKNGDSLCNLSRPLHQQGRLRDARGAGAGPVGDSGSSRASRQGASIRWRSRGRASPSPLACKHTIAVVRVGLDGWGAPAQ